MRNSLLLLLLLLLLAFGVSSAAAAPDPKPASPAPKTAVEYAEPDNAMHPHLSSYTMRMVEGKAEAFKEVHTFGADGRMTRLQTYRDGQRLDTIDFEWDVGGRMTRRTAKDETGEVRIRNFVYTLDKTGRIAEVAEHQLREPATAGHKDVFHWDAKGGYEVVSSHHDAGGPDVVEMTATFDAAGRVTKRCTSTAMVTRAVPAKTTCELRSYDSHGAVTQIRDEHTTPTSHPRQLYTNTYAKNGTLTRSVEAGKYGITRSYTWNPSGDVATVTETLSGSTTVTTYSYEAR